MAKTSKLPFITSFIAQFFQMKDQFFSTIFEASHENVLSGSDSGISEMLLFGISSFNDTKNTSILNTTIDYILSTKRFDVRLTNFWFDVKHLCIENMSLIAFNCRIVYEVFTVLYYWFRDTTFNLPCQLGFSSNYHYFHVSIYRLFLSFMFVNKCLPVKKLA